MTQAEAEAKLTWMTAATTEPVIDPATITAILLENELSEGVWDFNRAAAQGWDLKAGAIADRFRFEEDDQVFHRNQAFDHCQKMSKRYQKGAVLVEMTPEEPVA